MLVEEVMTVDVVCRDRSVSLREIAEAMLGSGITSVVIEEDDAPRGIVTETDVVYAGFRTDDPYSQIPVADAMSYPLITIQPDKTLRKAIYRMGEEGVKKLAVVDGLELRGIVSLTDLAYHYSDLVNEIQAVENAHGDWIADRELFDIDE
jgi:CBS domain-containing protein